MKKTQTIKIGRLELSILSIIKKMDLKECYGTAIWIEIENLENRRISSGAIYTTIYRLVNKGLLLSQEGEPTSQKGGKKKKFYYLTKKGEQLIQKYSDIFTINHTLNESYC